MMLQAYGFARGGAPVKVKGGDREQDQEQEQDEGIPFRKRSQSHKWRFEGFLLRKTHEKKVTKCDV